MYFENQCKNNLKLILRLFSLQYAESVLVRKEKYHVIAALCVIICVKCTINRNKKLWIDLLSRSLLELNNLFSHRRRVQMPVSRWGAVAVSRAPPVVARRNKRSPRHSQPQIICRRWASQSDLTIDIKALRPQHSSSNQHSVDMHCEWETGKNASERENEWGCVRGTHKIMRRSVCVCLTCHWCVWERDNLLKRALTLNAQCFILHSVGVFS